MSVLELCTSSTRLSVPLGIFFHLIAGDRPAPLLRVPSTQHEAHWGRELPFTKEVEDTANRAGAAARGAEVGGCWECTAPSLGAPDTSTISQHMAKARIASIFRAICTLRSSLGLQDSPMTSSSERAKGLRAESAEKIKLIS